MVCYIGFRASWEYIIFRPTIANRRVVLGLSNAVQELRIDLPYRVPPLGTLALRPLAAHLALVVRVQRDVHVGVERHVAAINCSLAGYGI